MPKVMIDAGLVFDGEYELDFEGQPLTNWEFHVIKKVSGVRAGEVVEALGASDVDVVVALAVIALQRAGRVTKQQVQGTADALFDAEVGKVRYSEEADVDPPAVTPGSEGQTDSATGSSSASLRSDGDAPSEITPTPTGDQDSSLFAQSISRT